MEKYYFIHFETDLFIYYYEHCHVKKDFTRIGSPVCLDCQYCTNNDTVEGKWITCSRLKESTRKQEKSTIPKEAQDLFDMVISAYDEFNTALRNRRNNIEN